MVAHRWEDAWRTLTSEQYQFSLSSLRYTTIILSFVCSCLLSLAGSLVRMIHTLAWNILQERGEKMREKREDRGGKARNRMGQWGEYQREFRLLPTQPPLPPTTDWCSRYRMVSRIVKNSIVSPVMAMAQPGTSAPPAHFIPAMGVILHILWSRGNPSLR